MPPPVSFIPPPGSSQRPFLPIMMEGALVLTEGRHDRGVGDAQALHAVGPQPVVHHGHRVGAHLAGADRVPGGFRVLLHPTASTTSSTWPAMRRCAASPASTTPPARGTANAASSPGSRRRRAGSMRATPSLRSPASLDISTKASVAPAWSRRPPASASISPRPVPTPPCCGSWRAASRPRDPDRLGAVLRRPRSRQPQTPTPMSSNPGTVKAPNTSPCALEINR